MEAFLTSQGLAAAVLVIFLAGLSDGVGTRAAVLLINRISPLAFALSLFAAALLFLLSAALWVWGIWLAATYLFGVQGELSIFFVAISASYSPLMLNALALLPLVGPLLRWALRLWGFAIALGALVYLGLTLWQAALCAACGGLLVAGASWLLSEPATYLGRWLWSKMTGSPRPLRIAELPRAIPGYAPRDEIAL